MIHISSCMYLREAVPLFGGLGGLSKGKMQWEREELEEGALYWDLRLS